MMFIWILKNLKQNLETLSKLAKRKAGIAEKVVFSVDLIAKVW